MEYGLQKTVKNGGKDLDIRYDFRVILDILEVINDPEFTNAEKAEAIINIFYVNPEEITDVKEAIEECFTFIDSGQKPRQGKSPKLVDWQQDFAYIIAPINRVLGIECRDIPYDPDTNTGGLHWWTFTGAYMEIGSECLFSQIVNIRDKKARGKPLEKYEREWYRRNADLINLKTHYTENEEAFFREWGEVSG